MFRWFVVAAVLVGCRGGKSGPASAPEQDALWKLAPLTATRGVVASSKGVAALGSAWREVARLFDTVPDLAVIGDAWREEFPTLFPRGEISLAAAGMSPDRGAAVFMSPSGARVVILPVTDRAKFVAFANGTTSEDGDHIGELTCRTVRDHYACAKPVEQLGRLGGGDLGDHAKLAGRRADIEIALVNEEEKSRVGAVADLRDGQLVLRGAIRAPSLAGKIKNASSQSFDTSKQAGFAVLNIGSALASLPLPREPIVAGISLADLVGGMAGPVIISLPSGVRQGEIRVPMKTPRIAETLVAKCEEIPHLAILSSRFREGACHLTVPGVSLDFDVRVVNGELRARTKHAGARDVTLQPTPLAKEIAAGTWAFAVYGRGTIAGSFSADTEIPEAGRFGLRLMSLVNEGAIAVRADSDTLRFVVGFRTVWSNPDDVVANWLAIPVEELVAAEALESVHARIATTPTVPLVADIHAGTAVYAPMSAAALIAGYAFGGVVEKLRARRESQAGPDDALATMREFKDAMCECNDAACAKDVSDAMMTWTMEQARQGRRPPTLTAQQQAEAARLGEAMGVCMQQAFNAGAGGAAADYITKNKAFKDRLCACKDAACAETVSREMTTWSEEYVKNVPPDSTMSAAEDKQMQAIEASVRECMQRLRAKVQ